MTKKERGFKVVIAVAVILLVVGIILLVISSFLSNPSCKEIVNEALSKEMNGIEDYYQGKRFAIYLVGAVNTCCRPLYRFKKLKTDESMSFEIYVNNDFSENDIENFRYAFEIPPQIQVERIENGNVWVNMVNKCRMLRDDWSNVFLLLNDNVEIEEMVSF